MGWTEWGVYSRTTQARRFIRLLLQLAMSAIRPPRGQAPPWRRPSPNLDGSSVSTGEGVAGDATTDQSQTSQEEEAGFPPSASLPSEVGWRGLSTVGPASGHHRSGSARPKLVRATSVLPGRAEPRTGSRVKLPISDHRAVLISSTRCPTFARTRWAWRDRRTPPCRFNILALMLATRGALSLLRPHYHALGWIRNNEVAHVDVLRLLPRSMPPRGTPPSTEGATPGDCTSRSKEIRDSMTRGVIRRGLRCRPTPLRSGCLTLRCFREGAPDSASPVGTRHHHPRPQRHAGPSVGDNEKERCRGSPLQVPALGLDKARSRAASPPARDSARRLSRSLGCRASPDPSFPRPSQSHSTSLPGIRTPSASPQRLT